ncbi:uncharacterized protein K444DRAFT_666645 [Hyaloscypha bicolor E]|uniref:Uncharacterized protein n=1 Tax=Hyaloscypha bicolor E TaxID=1095630 RepID=A0A2J6SZ19_9HELO|nr:uncharacterized protein K444DRAFT_666645 [Hyaloscypha bicolor E]PMD56012.1 hypothetical protein K444DRAFT_666645 [Hyaloscypha bicolor E]
MATVKMAISSRDSTSILYSAQTVAGKFCHTFTFFDRISDETLDTLVGLCAGRGALLCIERKQSAKLITRLSATQTPAPILDDATWAAQVGGSIVGEIEGHRSHLTPWAEPNFGVKFLYRRAADETVSSKDPKYPIYPHDGALYSELLKWKTSKLFLRPAAPTAKSSPDSLPVSSNLPRTPLSTLPPSDSTSKQISHLPTATDCPRRPTPLIVVTPITPPTSPTAGESFRVRDDIMDRSNSCHQQIPTKIPKHSPASSALLSVLFSEEKERGLNRRKRAGRTQPNPKYAEENSEVKNREETGDDSGSCMDSFEVAAMRRQQNQRLQRKGLAPPTEYEENVTDRKPNKPQARPVKVGRATRGPRVHFREREPPRRRAPARAIENNAV